MAVAGRVDRTLRDLAHAAAATSSAPSSAARSSARRSTSCSRGSSRRPSAGRSTAAERTAIVDEAGRRPTPTGSPRSRSPTTWRRCSERPRERLIASASCADRPDLLSPPPTPWSRRSRPRRRPARRADRPTLFARITDAPRRGARGAARGADQDAQLGAVRPRPSASPPDRARGADEAGPRPGARREDRRQDELEALRERAREAVRRPAACSGRRPRTT